MSSTNSLFQSIIDWITKKFSFITNTRFIKLVLKYQSVLSGGLLIFIVINCSIMLFLTFNNSTISTDEFNFNEPITVININSTSNSSKQANRTINSVETVQNTSQHNHTYIIKPLNYSSMPYYTNKSVIFLGMVSNANQTLPHILEQLNEVSCLFNNTFFLFFGI